jgi:hypothetical protein
MSGDDPRPVPPERLWLVLEGVRFMDLFWSQQAALQHIDWLKRQRGLPPSLFETTPFTCVAYRMRGARTTMSTENQQHSSNTTEDAYGFQEWWRKYGQALETRVEPKIMALVAYGAGRHWRSHVTGGAEADDVARTGRAGVDQAGRTDAKETIKVAASLTPLVWRAHDICEQCGAHKVNCECPAVAASLTEPDTSKPAFLQLLQVHERLLMDEPNERGEYVHHIYCNASRLQPVGNDMCSCPIGRRIKASTAQLTALTALVAQWREEALLRVESGPTAIRHCADELEAAFAASAPTPDPLPAGIVCRHCGKPESAHVWTALPDGVRVCPTSLYQPSAPTPEEP